MSAAGHVQDMNNRMRQNRNALKSKKAKFKEKKIYRKKHQSSGLVLDDINLTREELENIKAEIREEARADRVLEWVRISFGVIVVSGVIISIFRYALMHFWN